MSDSRSDARTLNIMSGQTNPQLPRSLEHTLARRAPGRPVYLEIAHVSCVVSAWWPGASPASMDYLCPSRDPLRGGGGCSGLFIRFHRRQYSVAPNAAKSGGHLHIEARYGMNESEH